MKNQVLIAVFLSLIFSAKSWTQEMLPSSDILSRQFRDNNVVLFGTVVSVEKKAEETSREFKGLQGFRNFVVTLKVKQIWSKKPLKKLPTKYTVEFGMMLDVLSPNKLPVLNNESLALVLDDLQQDGKIHLLRDHLLDVYQQTKDLSLANKFILLPKVAMNFEQEPLDLSKFSSLAYREQMIAYRVNGSQVVDESEMVSSTKEEERGRFLASIDGEEAAVSDKNIKRSLGSAKQNEEGVSVSSLLIIFLCMAVFSHFLIKYYDPEEDY